ncbi:hypothetical protein [Novosphingobium aquimarinum]|uniref:hypothetical protein n=1 Tax=Novosphingobium aquimarinum TaxID=2682494 RepID=UPI0018DE1AFF|nr:hypothetical protein [Novosphingobium aquimarinum]
MFRGNPSGRSVLGTLALVGLLVVAGCEQTEENVSDGGIEKGKALTVCDEALLAPAAIAAHRESDAALRRAFAAGKLDPSQAAHEAVEAGDFRLIANGAASEEVDATYGVQCALPNGLDAWTVRGMIAETQDGRETGPDLERFATQYNREIVADPGYPYGDICRPTDPSLTPTRTGSGFVKLGAPRTQYDAAEAARRGDAWRLRQLRRREPSLLHQPDMFGMTPLAWAIAYREPVAVDYLLKAGADPTGTNCRAMPDAQSPLQLARAMKWQSAVLRMRPRLAPGTFEELREEPRMLEKSELAYRKALIDIGSKYQKQLMRQKRSVQRVTFEIDAKGAPTSCRLEPGTAVPDFDAEICAIGIAQLRWRAARNPFGVEVPGETTISVRTAGY